MCILNTVYPLKLCEMRHHGGIETIGAGKESVIRLSDGNENVWKITFLWFGSPEVLHRSRHCGVDVDYRLRVG